MNKQSLLLGSSTLAIAIDGYAVHSTETAKRHEIEYYKAQLVANAKAHGDNGPYMILGPHGITRITDAE